MTGTTERHCPSCRTGTPFDGPWTVPVVHCSGTLEIREEWTCRQCHTRTSTPRRPTAPRPSCLPGPDPGSCH
ncbi:hypothetical protein ACIBCA_25195 [Kitasatospora sp. NPDC051170]|uniref:hypothetical protein n=1 Tax=Kitasatospora sp. NPDC051170 TaxID=3364056 RepID=UPI0037AA101E